MPVREALRLLEAEGFVEFFPNRGAVVARAEPVQISEVFQIRNLLEVHAIRQSVPNLTEEDLERASELQAEIEAEVDISKWGDLNQKFHLSLYSGCEGRHLVGIIEDQYRLIDRYVRLLLSNDEYLVQSNKEHREIIDACWKRDPDAAAGALHKHLADGGVMMLQRIKNMNPRR